MKRTESRDVDWSELVAPEQPLQIVRTLIRLWPFFVGGLLAWAFGQMYAQAFSPSRLVDGIVWLSGFVSVSAMVLTVVLLLFNILRIVRE